MIHMFYIHSRNAENILHDLTTFQIAKTDIVAIKDLVHRQSRPANREWRRQCVQ
jgi:hypothetical protein